MKKINYILFLISSNIILFASCKSEPDASKMRIAYNVLVDPATENYDIYVMDIDGNNTINISNNECLDWAYSSYGDKLYLISDRDTCTRCYFLYETDTKGSYWNKVSKTQIQDSWVPTRSNGKELIIKPAGLENEPFQIIDINGNVTATVDPKMDYFNDPCFSPDGESILFRGYNGDLSKANQAELYTFNLSTQEKNRLTKYPSNAKTFGHYQYHASPARWNAKYGKITYSSSLNNTSTIKSIDAIEKKPKNITQTNVKAMWHDISPDGKYLAFDAKLNYSADSATTHIFIMDFEKRNSKIITKGKGYKQGPVFVYEK